MNSGIDLKGLDDEVMELLIEPIEWMGKRKEAGHDNKWITSRFESELNITQNRITSLLQSRFKNITPICSFGFSPGRFKIPTGFVRYPDYSGTVRMFIEISLIYLPNYGEITHPKSLKSLYSTVSHELTHLWQLNQTKLGKKEQSPNYYTNLNNVDFALWVNDPMEIPAIINGIKCNIRHEQIADDLRGCDYGLFNNMLLKYCESYEDVYLHMSKKTKRKILAKIYNYVNM